MQLDLQLDNASLQGKNILVTGCGSDLGHTIAFAAARYGATVLMLGRKQREMNSLYDQICDAGYSEPLIIEFDILKSDKTAYQNLSNTITQHLDQYSEELHGLVHSAIWGAPLTPIAHADMDVWQKTLDQHLVKPMYLTKVLLPLLNKPHPSSIIFPVLETGRKGRAYWGAVGGAFAGIENLSETLSDECENANTRVNTLDCTNIKTAIRKKFYPAEPGNNLLPLDAPEVIQSFIYLLSDHNTDSGIRHRIGVF